MSGALGLRDLWGLRGFEGPGVLGGDDSLEYHWSGGDMRLLEVLGVLTTLG